MQKRFTFKNSQYLQESICFELKISDKTYNFLSLYWSPSQSQDENLELNLENLVQRNPFLIVAIVDFNAKSGNWFRQDKTSFEQDAIENLASQFGLHQLIKEPTHIKYFFIVYWPNLLVRTSLVFTFKLSSSDNLCKIWFRNHIPSTLCAGELAR